MASLKWFATILESALTVADQLGDSLGADVTCVVGRGEQILSFAGMDFQFSELAYGEGREKDVMVLTFFLVALGVLSGDEPGALI